MRVLPQLFICFSLMFVCSREGIAQVSLPPAAHTSCLSAMAVCSDTLFGYDNRINGECPAPPVLYYTFEMGQNDNPVFSYQSNQPILSWDLYGPFASPDQGCGGLDSSNRVAGALNNPPVNFATVSQMLAVGSYILVVRPQNCHGGVQITFRGKGYACRSIPQLPCENCIGSFAPIPGNRYIISAWVKEENASYSTSTYTNAGLRVNFPSENSQTSVFLPAGVIIEGWQRLEGDFVIPANSTNLQIELICTSGTALFDDIRIIPYDGSMKTYVYDPVTLRLVAELDERNYATFYEYDEEGKLIRIKKETERGIMTIQESKTSVRKQ